MPPFAPGWTYVALLRAHCSKTYPARRGSEFLLGKIQESAKDSDIRTDDAREFYVRTSFEFDQESLYDLSPVGILDRLHGRSAPKDKIGRAHV